MLSESEFTALQMLQDGGGAILITDIDTETRKDIFGFVIPGERVFKKLIKKGFLFITEEETDEDGFDWTPMYQITDKGEAAYKEYLGN